MIALLIVSPRVLTHQQTMFPFSPVLRLAIPSFSWLPHPILLIATFFRAGVSCAVDNSGPDARSRVSELQTLDNSRDLFGSGVRGDGNADRFDE